MNDRKKRIIFFIIIGLAISILIPIAATSIYFLVENKMNLTLLNEEYFKEICFSLETYKNFYNFKIDNPFKFLGYILIGYYILMFILREFTAFKPKKAYEKMDDYGSHGTSRWQNKYEIRENYYKDDIGWFLGSEKQEDYKIGMKGAYHPVEGKLNMQMTVVGSPGCNKTTGFVLPNILHLANVYSNRDKKKKKSILFKIIKNIKFLSKLEKIKELDKKDMPDLIVTDPKSELYSLTADELIRCGYDVKVLDYITLKHGDSLNTIEFIDSEEMLMQIAKGYVDSVEQANGGAASGDAAFWNEQESQVLAALIGFVMQKYSKDITRQTFTEITKILTSDDVADIDSAKEFFVNNNIKGAPLQLWNNFLMIADSDRTRANILGGLATKLKLFALEGVQNITGSTTLDIRKLGRKKDKPIALFIFMKDSDRTFSPIINVSISTIFKTLYNTAYDTGNKLEVPVYFILEEMANIGKIPDIQEMLGTMRGRRIYPMMIWQSFSQMKNRYGDGWEDIVSMCDTIVYLGVNDDFTAKYCSNALGDTTIKIQNTSKKGDVKLFDLNDKSESIAYNSRKLMFPDEVRRNDNNLFIIWQRSRFPALLYKVQYKYWENKLCKQYDWSYLPKLKKAINENIDTSSSVFKENEFVREEQYKEVNNEEVNNIDSDQEYNCFEDKEIADDVLKEFNMDGCN